MTTNMCHLWRGSPKLYTQTIHLSGDWHKIQVKNSIIQYGSGCQILELRSLGVTQQANALRVHDHTHVICWGTNPIEGYFNLPRFIGNTNVHHRFYVMKPGKVTTLVILGEPWQWTYNSVPNLRRERINFEYDNARLFTPFLNDEDFTTDLKPTRTSYQSRQHYKSGSEQDCSKKNAKQQTSLMLTHNYVDPKKAGTSATRLFIDLGS